MPTLQQDLQRTRQTAHAPRINAAERKSQQGKCLNLQAEGAPKATDQDTSQDERKHTRASHAMQEIPPYQYQPITRLSIKGRHLQQEEGKKERTSTQPMPAAKIKDLPEQAEEKTPPKPQGHWPPRSMQTQSPTPTPDRQTRKKTNSIKGNKRSGNNTPGKWLRK